MPHSKWNYIKVTGNNNLIIQDANGNSFEIAIEAFIEKFTHEKEEQIQILKARISDRQIIQQYADERIIQLSNELRQLVQEKAELQQRITEMLVEFNEKDMSNTNVLYQQAFDLFITGELDKAIESLNDFKLQEELNKIENQENKIAEEKKKFAEVYSLKGRMQMLKFDFHSAIESSKKATLLDPLNALLWSNLGIVLFNDGKLTDALEHLEKAIQLSESNLEAQHEGGYYVIISTILMELANYNKAYEYIKKALEIADRHNNLTLTVDVFSRLGKLSGIVGNYEEELNYNKAAYEIWKRYYSEGDKLSELTNNLGVAYHTLNIYDKALIYFEECLELERKIAKTDLEIGGNIFFNMGCAKEGIGQKKQALELMFHAIEIDKLLYTENHLYMAKYYHNIGPILIDEEPERAKEYLYKALEIREKAYPETHPQRAESYAALAIVVQLSDPALSVEYFKKAIAIREKLFGYEDSEVASWYLYLATSYGYIKDLINSHKYYEITWLRIQSNEVLKQQFSQIIENSFNSSAIILSEETFKNQSPFIFLIGIWEGTYSYEIGFEGLEYSFKLFLQASPEGFIEGTCIEHGNEEEQSKMARIKGKILSNKEIEFKKKYLKISGISDEEGELVEESPLVYIGNYLEREKRFDGKWEIATLISEDQIYSTKGYWQMKKITIK